MQPVGHSCLLLYSINYLVQSNNSVTRTEPILQVIGNKADLRHVREIPVDRAEAFAREHGLAFIETSAKDNENVALAFEKLVATIFEQKTRRPGLTGPSSQPPRSPMSPPPVGARIQLGQTTQQKQDECQC